MTALAITDRGVEVDHLASVDLHPAAKLFPPLRPEQYTALLGDIGANGQRESILMTPDGQLLDGRSRWRACKELGVTPITKVVHGNPWKAALLANKDRASKSVRGLAVARMPNRLRGDHDYYIEGRVPTRADAAKLIGIGSTIATREAVTTLRSGIPELIAAVEEDLVPLGTAYRAALMNADEQLDFVARVRGGESARNAIRPRPAPVAYRDNRRPGRHSLVTVPAIENITNQLEALGMVIDTAPDGLDPGITSEEAGQLMTRLSTANRSLGRLRSLLKERKDRN